MNHLMILLQGTKKISFFSFSFFFFSGSFSFFLSLSVGFLVCFFLDSLTLYGLAWHTVHTGESEQEKKKPRKHFSLEQQTHTRSLTREGR